jgi:hypothetical protein
MKGSGSCRVHPALPAIALKLGMAAGASAPLPAMDCIWSSMKMMLAPAPLPPTWLRPWVLALAVDMAALGAADTAAEAAAELVPAEAVVAIADMTEGSMEVAALTATTAVVAVLVATLRELASTSGCGMRVAGPGGGGGGASMAMMKASVSSKGGC